MSQEKWLLLELIILCWVGPLVTWSWWIGGESFLRDVSLILFGFIMGGGTHIFALIAAWYIEVDTKRTASSIGGGK